MIKPLTIASSSYATNIIQGPLAGVSCAPFRRLVWEYSQPAFSYTEMISCSTLLHQTKAKERYIKKDEREGPVCFQLAGQNPQELAEATKRVTDYGADLVDLNCGCPVKKIRSRGAGSSLLSKPHLLYQLMRAMKQNTHLPVSIKIRVDGDSSDQCNQAIVEAINEAGIDFVVVHGRHWSEGYDVSCRYDQIRFFVENLKIPVIGNGDIACRQSLRQMFATQCAGVMIARAGVGQPWLIKQLRQELLGEAYVPPTMAEVGDVFITHINELALLLHSEKFAVIQARSLAKYYARNLEKRQDFCKKMMVCDGMQAFEQLCHDYFC